MRPFRVSLWATAILIVLSGLTYLFGPNPTIWNPPDLFPDFYGTRETRDSIIVASWIIGGLTLFVHLCRTVRSRASSSPEEASGSTSLFLPLVIFGIYFASATIDFDQTQTGNYSPFSIADLAVSSLAVLTTTSLIVTSRKSAQGYSLILFVALLVPIATILWQTPGSLRDEGHYPYLANEIAGFVAGEWPLADFSPQYTTLLGLVLVPVQWLPKLNIEATVLGLQLLIQVLCLAMPLALVKRLGGIRLLPFSLLMISSTYVGVSVSGSNSNPASIFSFSARHFLPMALLSLVAVGFLRKNRGSVFYLGCGALAGCCALNNPDFGLAALGSAAVVSTVYLGLRRNSWMKYLLLSLGALSPVLFFYGSSLVLRKDLEWGSLFYFQRLFGLSGFGREPMAVAGLHFVFFSTFLLGMAIGTVVYVRFNTTRNANLGAASWIVLYSSMWGLLSTPYFMGRSFTSTLIGGHGIQVALIVIGAGISLSNDRSYFEQALRRSSAEIGLAALLGFVSIVLAAAFFRQPSSDFNSAILLDSSLHNPELAITVKEIHNFVDQDGRIHDATMSGKAGSVVRLSSVVEKLTGVESVLIISHPGYLALSPVVLQKQCDRIMSEKLDYLFVENDDSGLVEALKACLGSASHRISSTGRIAVILLQ